MISSMHLFAFGAAMRTVFDGLAAVALLRHVAARRHVSALMVALPSSKLCPRL